MDKQNDPQAYYGVLDRRPCDDVMDAACEELDCLGFAVIDSGYSATELGKLKTAVTELRRQYVATWGEAFLRQRDEFHTVRLPLAYGQQPLVELAFNEAVLNVVSRMIRGSYVLNQQNLIINPPGENYNQSAWHRDLPYQHFVSSRALAINALFCLDDFTAKNGASFVIPASHKIEEFPSQQYIDRHAVQVEAPAGSFILMNCMTYHRGGFNSTKAERLGVNHVYTIPFIKQQISIPACVECGGFSEQRQKILGVPYQVPGSVEAYLKGRPLRDS